MHLLFTDLIVSGWKVDATGNHRRRMMNRWKKYGIVGLAIFTGVAISFALLTPIPPTPETHKNSVLVERDEDQPGQVMIIQGQLPPTEVALQQAKRSLVLQEWLQGVGEVIEKTNKDEGVMKLLNALAVGRLCMPVENGVLFLESAEGMEHWIAVTPVLPEDRKIPGLAPTGITRAGATFSPATNVMMLHDTNMSKTWRGILFLHELDHADRFFTDRYNWQDIRTYCHEELKVHKDQNRWVSKIGGERYLALVNVETNRQRKTLEEEGIQLGQGFPQRTEYDPALDDIFGPALSKDEKDFRQTQVWMHGHFNLLDSIADASDEVKDELKAIFLKTLYRDGGILDQFNK